MLTAQRVTVSKIAYVFATAILGLTASSCGHSEASPPAPSMEVVMQAVHDYGRSNEGSVLPPPAPISQETDEHYTAGIKEMIVESDFAQLEKTARQNRTERGLLLGGEWKNNAFYNQLASPMNTGEATDEGYRNQITRLNQWVTAYPDSVAPRIALAHLYTNYAFFARGDGSADSVSNSQWRLYTERNILAEQYLLAAARLKDRDAFWYEAMQEVAFQVGWDKPHALDLLHQAVAFEPSYYHYYRLYADYLRPQWYGEPGDIVKFAEQASLQLHDPDASILYFRITSTLACNCEPQIADLPGINWPKFKSGYSDVIRLYGPSNLNASRLAWVAFKLGDKLTAQQAFGSIDHMEMDVWWGPHTFANARDWANTP
jgi:hypothetical protein